jgi:hypothetical protein
VASPHAEREKHALPVAIGIAREAQGPLNLTERQFHSVPDSKWGLTPTYSGVNPHFNGKSNKWRYNSAVGVHFLETGIDYAMDAARPPKKRGLYKKVAA